MRPLFLGTALMAALLATVHAQQPVTPRRENQQDRIARGVKSGKLTAGETAKLEQREAHVNRQVARDRRANGGKLTAGERRRVNRELNHTSRAIHRDKHNGRVQR